MSEKMPEALRKHFESKQKDGEGDEKHSEKSKMARREALRKAKKAKMKRSSEKNEGKA
jgi:DNA-binding protein H-NS